MDEQIGVSPHSRDTKGLYIVHAWVSDNRLCIGQRRVEDKSNEITAIPALLDELSLDDAGAVSALTICQRSIAKQIHSKRGHYLLALKENHSGDMLVHLSYHNCDTIETSKERQRGCSCGTTCAHIRH
jgi:hypothetical protein